jgi:hypothetical protein
METLPSECIVTQSPCRHTQAEDASRAKSELLSALSHEIRTPLQAVTGFTEVLGTLDLPEDRRRAALGHIAGACSHILSLVDDVLEVARIEAAALPLNPSVLALDDILGEVVDLMQPASADRRITLEREPSGLMTLADPRRLRQVLLNLVANAVRYNKRTRSSTRGGSTDGQGRSGPDRSRGLPGQDAQSAVLGADDLVALGLRQPTPHAIRLVHGKRVRTTPDQDRTAAADLLGAGLPTRAGRAAFVLRMEEQRAVHPSTRTAHLPIPDVGDRNREPVSVRHVRHPLRWRHPDVEQLSPY